MSMEPIVYIYKLVMFLFCAGFFIIFIRLMKGPSPLDRVLSLDLLALNAIGLIGSYSIISGSSVYLRAAIVLGLIAVLGTIAFTLYFEKKANHD